MGRLSRLSPLPRASPLVASAAAATPQYPRPAALLSPAPAKAPSLPALSRFFFSAAGAGPDLSCPPPASPYSLGPQGGSLDPVRSSLFTGYPGMAGGGGGGSAEPFDGSHSTAEHLDGVYADVQDEEPAAAAPTLSSLFTGETGESSVVVVDSVETFDKIYSKLRDEKLPGVLYYTAAWCRPCKTLAPAIAKLSNRYPNIPIFKIDMDMDGIGIRLYELEIYSVPVFHFYGKGEKINEATGGSVTEAELKAAMESLDLTCS